MFYNGCKLSASTWEKQIVTKLRVLVVFGTRPEAIKMAPVVRALAARPADFETLTLATAQHREMLDQVLALFAITPDVDLNLMQPGQTPSMVAARLLERLDPLLGEMQPDWVLVQGDTTTVMASAIAAHHRRARVGHVEAGLRTGDMANPFPEEMNRVVTDHISELCFAPTTRSRDNLLREGIAPERILVTGNTVVDALEDVARRPWTPPFGSDLARLDPATPLILVTAHRRESFGVPLERIYTALREIAAADPRTCADHLPGTSQPQRPRSRPSHVGRPPQPDPHRAGGLPHAGEPDEAQPVDPDRFRWDSGGSAGARCACAGDA